MSYTWILFDADNTLFDYDKAEAVALQVTFEQFGHAWQPSYLETYRQINHQIWLEFEQGQITQARLKATRFVRLSEALTLTPRPDGAAFSVAYLTNLGDCAQLIVGAVAVLAALKGRVRLALITNGMREVQRSRLAQSGLADTFEVIIISDEVGVAKPEAGIFDIAFAQMGHPRKPDVLIVGDSLTSDMRGGSDYDIDTCWYNPKRKPRTLEVNITYEIQDLAEVLALVEET